MSSKPVSALLFVASAAAVVALLHRKRNEAVSQTTPKTEINQGDKHQNGEGKGKTTENSSPSGKGKGMRGSVKPNDRHAIICYTNDLWPKSIDLDPECFASKLQTAIKTYLAEIHNQGDQGDGDSLDIKVTACHVPTGNGACGFNVSSVLGVTHGSDGGADNDDERVVIVYPDEKICRVKKSQIPEFVRRLCAKTYIMANKKESQDLPFIVSPTPWTRLVLVCVHMERDKRCGRAGPQIIESLTRQLESTPDAGIAVFGSSHIGGHEFAGTLIVYPSAVWYGQISKSNTDKLLENILANTVFEECYRGCTRLVEKSLEW